MRSFILIISQNIPFFFGSGFLGYALGFALKKVLKWMLIMIGFLAGMFFVGVQLLEKYGYVSAINWAANVDVTNIHGLFHTLGISVSGSMGLGFLAGFVRTR